MHVACTFNATCMTSLTCMLSMSMFTQHAYSMLGFGAFSLHVFQMSKSRYACNMHVFDIAMVTVILLLGLLSYPLCCMYIVPRSTYNL